MLQNIDRVKKLSRVFTVIAAILAFLAGVTDLLAPIDAIAVTATWLTAGFAFLSAFFGGTTLLLDKRQDTLEDKLKKTPPKLDVSIKTGQEDQKFYVVIEPKNAIPFHCSWRIVTSDNKIISGIMLDWLKVYPDEKQPYYTSLARMDLDKVVDDFIELRFEFRSINFSELRDLNLSGTITKQYKLSDDRRVAIPINENT